MRHRERERERNRESEWGTRQHRLLSKVGIWSGGAPVLPRESNGGSGSLQVRERERETKDSWEKESVESSCSGALSLSRFIWTVIWSESSEIWHSRQLLLLLQASRRRAYVYNAAEPARERERAPCRFLHSSGISRGRGGGDSAESERFAEVQPERGGSVSDDCKAIDRWSSFISSWTSFSTCVGEVYIYHAEQYRSIKFCYNICLKLTLSVSQLYSIIIDTHTHTHNTTQNRQIILD